MISQEKLQKICELLTGGGASDKVKASLVRVEAGGTLYGRTRVEGKEWFATADYDSSGLLGAWTVYGEDEEGRTIMFSIPPERTVRIPLQEATETAILVGRIWDDGTRLVCTRMYGQKYIIMSELETGRQLRMVAGALGFSGHGWSAARIEPTSRQAYGRYTFTANIDDGTTYTCEITLNREV